MRPLRNRTAIDMEPPINDLAQCHARNALRDAIHELTVAGGARCAEILDHAAYEMGRLVGHGLLDRSDAADALTEACVVNGYSLTAGPDLVQEAIVQGFIAGEVAAAAEQAAASDRTHENLGDTVIKTWPIMASKATHGIVGKIARLATANSEADPVAVIATALAYAGAEFSRSQFIRIGDSTHHSCHFEAIVGQSSRARKGTSFDPVKRIFKRADAIRTSSSTLPFPSGASLKISHGPLSSGEGLARISHTKKCIGAPNQRK